MTNPDSDLFDLEIGDIAYGGDGVGHLPDGMAVFVPFTAIGDLARIRLTERKKSFARAELVELLKAGPGRTTPKCPYYGTCGGCQYQHLDPNTELQVKTKQLLAALQRIGHLEELPPVEPVVASDEVYGYRNKVVLHPTRDAEDNPAYGYHTLDGGSIIPVATCPIANPHLQSAIDALQAQDVRPVPLTLRRAENNRVFRYYGKGAKHAPWLRESILGHRINVPLTAFTQVNDFVADAMVRWLQQQAKAAPSKVLIDLYCGVGIFALTIGNKAQRVIGIERDRESVKAARFNASQWDFKKAILKGGPVESVLPSLLDEMKNPDKTLVIIDPPRGGCEKSVIDALADWRPSRIFYVSCNPTSLSRDLKRLLDRTGYTISKLALFDMFPQTAHFESAVVLERK